jgi:Putative peptidoglycan binding domain
MLCHAGCRSVPKTNRFLVMSSELEGTTGAPRSIRLDLADRGSAPRPAGARPRLDDADESFQRSLDAFSRQLAARTADRPPDTGMASKQRFVDREQRGRGRLLVWVVAFALGAAAAAGGIYAFQPQTASAPPRAIVAPSPQPPAASSAALPDPAPSVQPPRPAPPVQPPRVEAAAVVAREPQPVAAPPEPAELQMYEILEVQARLKSLGMAPGPLDSISGPLTAAAVKRFEASKGQPQTGKVDRDLLKKLRQEPSPPSQTQRAAKQAP